MQTVGSILAGACSPFGVVEADCSVRDAVARMSQLAIGSLIVIDRSRILGLLTERDVVVRVVAAELDPSTVTVARAMTHELIIISPKTSLEDAMELAKDCENSQLLVVESGEICGLVSAEEISSYLVRDREALIGDLTYYITH